MALIHFTAEDVRHALLPSLGPEYAGQTVIRIDENVGDCEGIACGERPESAFSSEDLAFWLETHAERPPMPQHSHLVVRGSDPETRESIFAVLR